MSGAQTADITARMARDKDPYQVLVENTGVVLWEADPKTWRFTFVSGQVEKLLGYPRESWYEENFWIRHLHPLDREAAVQFCMQRTRDGENHRFQYRLVAAGGREVWVDDLVTVDVRDEKVVGIRGVIIDITEQKMAQISLEETSQRYRSVVTAMAEGIVLMDVEGRILASNDSAARILGISNDEMLGLTSYSPHWKTIHEDGSVFEPETHPVMVTLRTGVVCRNVIMGIHRPNGELRWISINSQPLIRDGESSPYSVVASFSDITERKKTEDALRASEERFRLQFENNPLSIFEWQHVNGQLILRGFNDAGNKFTKGHVAALVGREAADLFADRPDIVADMHAAFADQRPITRVMDYRLRVSQEPKYVVIRYVYVPPDFVMVHIEDITQQKVAQEHAYSLQAQLAHVARMGTLGEMAAGLTHEINQPLSAIANYAESSLIDLASGTINPIDLKANLNHIVAHAHRLAGISRWLRQFIHKREPVRGPLDLGKAIGEVLLLLDFELQQRRIRVRLELDHTLPIIKADVIQIQQVILNLIRNAAEATEGLSIDRLEICIRTRATASGGVELSVSDLGVGPRVEDLETLFDPFYSTKPDGLGIGLSLCRSIAQGHLGRLWATANRPFGMTFYLELPAGEPD